MMVELLLTDSQAKLRAALELVFASAAAYQPFVPGRIYSPQVREADVSETFRDLLLRMEKIGLISGLPTWITLRDLRNRVVHDYLPDELAALDASIVGEAVPEFRRLETAVARRLQ
jgi:hypothetical protein